MTVSLPSCAAFESIRRGALVAVVAASYLLPLMLGALADVGHGAEHLLDELGERRAKAAALGLVHLASPSYTHEHGGDVHSHVGGIAGLLVAADLTEDQQKGGTPPPAELSAHAPANAFSALLLPPLGRASPAADAADAESLGSAPLLPPPRA